MGVFLSIQKEKQTAINFVDDNHDWLSSFHQEIWRYAEPAFREYKSAKAYVDLLERGLQSRGGQR